MKIKVKFFNKRLIKDYLAVLAIISILSSIFSIYITIPDECMLPAILILSSILLTVYFLMWLHANIMKAARLTINQSTVLIRTGDIFKEKDFKVIAFNEYFDTQVDNRIISEKTLNGIYLREQVQDVKKLDQLISNDMNLKDKKLESIDHRLHGKKIKYKLGTIFQHNDYLLTAFSRFDKDNRAYLGMNDYINFLLNFWNEIDIIYAGRSISIPLLGSGITRFKDYNTISEQELLEGISIN